MKHLIKTRDNPVSFLFIESCLLVNFDLEGESIDLSKIVSEIRNEKVYSMTVNAAGVHWQLLVIVNSLDDSKTT